MADRPTYPGIPRWAKLQGIFAAILILIVIAMSTGLIGMGGHGAGEAMGGHMPPRGGH